MVKLEEELDYDMCYHPVYLKSKDLIVDCGKCFECRQKIARFWSMRLLSQLSVTPQSLFVTLTYNNDNYNTSSLDKRDAQLFLKRLRKRLWPRKIKYFIVGEYGSESFRKHMHAILFNVYMNDIRTVYDSWHHGNVDFGAVQSKSISYVTGYINKKIGEDLDLEDMEFQPSFRLMSKFIGVDFLNKNYNDFVRNMSFIYSGKNFPLPRYFRDKLGLIQVNPAYNDFITQKQISDCEKLSSRYGIPFNGDVVDFYLDLADTSYYDDKRIIAEKKFNKIDRSSI